MKSLRLARSVPLLAGFAVFVPRNPPLFAGEQPSPPKPVVRTEAELPRFTYELPTPTASALLSDAAFAKLADQVRRDLEALLAGYEIADQATRRGIHGTLEELALLERNYDAALQHAAKVRELEDKPAQRLLSGLVTQAVVAAERGGGEPAARRAAFRSAYAAAIDALPWDVVQDAVEQTKGQVEILSANFLTGVAQSQFDAGASKSGRISGDVARALIGMRAAIETVIPYREPLIEVLQTYIDSHRTRKRDIWAERDVAFPDARGLQPVVIAVWDSGVDAGVFGERMARSAGETANRRDDDGNGFVDDVHGIAYALWGGDPVPELLYPLDPVDRERLPAMRGQVKGFLDLQASVDSPEARAIKQRIAGMQPAEVQPFIEGLWRFYLYVHGTHVAGIATAGNPAAHILIVRETFPYQTIPPPVTLEVAARWAAKFQRTVDYLAAHGVRVVNMSWGLSAKEIEAMYEANAIGATADERQRMAQEAFDLLLDGMRRAMASAPGILFVPAAGNSDEDVGFTATMPAAIDLPNVLTVGAVDQAGDETSFTSHGRRVRVHANGFEVESYLPGGDRLPLSGTSMAAPNAANLAAKLLALDPKLTPQEVVELMLAGATRSEDGRRVLIDARRSVALLKERRH